MFVRALISLLVTVTFCAASAAAQTVSATAPPDEPSGASRVSFGARVGGYGFREVGGGRFDWQDCRMDGIGVFLIGDVHPNVFGEVSADIYNATEAAVAGGMDRTSAHLQGALGLRMYPNAAVTPFVQIGGGAEWTRFKVLGGAESQQVLPTGFVGTGGEMNLSDHLKLGLTLRMYIMGLPDGTLPSTSQALAAQVAAYPEDQAQSEVQYQAATQMQFFVRYAL